MTHTTTDAAEARALKACPFCGGDAEFQVDHGRNCIGVGCTRCTANQPPSWDFASKRWAAEAWNNRATAEAASGAGEREGSQPPKPSWCECYPDPVDGLDYICDRHRELGVASLPPATDPAMVAGNQEWCSPDIRDLHTDVERLRTHDLGGQRLRDLLQGAMDMLRAADKEIAALAAAPTIPATEGVVASNDGVRFSDVVEHFQETGGLEKVGFRPSTGHAATEGEGA